MFVWDKSLSLRLTCFASGLGSLPLWIRSSFSISLFAFLNLSCRFDLELTVGFGRSNGFWVNPVPKKYIRFHIRLPCFSHKDRQSERICQSFSLLARAPVLKKTTTVLFWSSICHYYTDWEDHVYLDIWLIRSKSQTGFTRQCSYFVLVNSFIPSGLV